MADDPLPTFIADLEAKMHDPSVLPHMHSEDEIENMFPTIPAAPGPKNSEDYTDARRYYSDVDIVANATSRA